MCHRRPIELSSTRRGLGREGDWVVKQPNSDAEFFIRSLDDLENERHVGDISDDDFEHLTDSYTVKAARSLGASGPSGPVVRRPARRGRAAAWIVGCVAVAALAGAIVARQSGQRSSVDLANGSVNESVAGLLARARANLGTSQSEALKTYAKVLERDPANPEALTYRGWIRGVVGLSDCNLQNFVLDGIKDIELAIVSDPNFADARVFHANLLRSLGRNKEAHAEYVKAKEIDSAGAFASLIDTPMAETKDTPDTAGECAATATTTS